MNFTILKINPTNKIKYARKCFASNFALVSKKIKQFYSCFPLFSYPKHASQYTFYFSYSFNKQNINSIKY